jgi:hypothetical protein
MHASNLPRLRLTAGLIRQAQRRQEPGHRNRRVTLVAQSARVTGRRFGREHVAPVSLAARLLQRRELRRVKLVLLGDGVPQRAAAGR